MNKFIKIISLYFIIALFFVSIFFTGKVEAQNEANFYIVKYSEEKTVSEVAILFNINTNKVQALPEFGAFRIELEDSSGGYDPDSAKTLEYFQPDYIYTIPENITPLTSFEKKFSSYLTPNDPGYSSQWGLVNISASSAWDKTTGSSGTIIAVVDTGIDGTHADLSGKVLAGYDYVNNRTISANTDSDDQGHGTSVGGVAAATSNNSLGITGVNWNANLLPVKVLDSDGSGYSSDVAYGIRYAADNGAKIINMSLGSRYPSELIEEAVNYAYGKGCVLVAASGNDGSSISYPAAYDNVIAVGATDSSDTRASWSNYGNELDVVAPGINIYTLADGGNYRTVSGTSLSSPFVSGLAALVSSYNTSLNNSQIMINIRDYADEVSGMGGSDFSPYYGYGRINASASLGGTHSTNPNDYHHSWVSQNAYPTLSSGESYTFEVIVKNTGVATWDQDVVRLGTGRPSDRIPFYTRGNGWRPTGDGNRILMQEAQVAPGENAHFNFTVTIPDGTGPQVYREYFRLVADGVCWMEDYGIYWDITVPTPHYEYVSQTPHSSDPEAAFVTVSPGETTTLTLTVKNTGLSTWYKTGVNPIRLGTSHPRDRISNFGRGSGWLTGSTNRVELTDNTVAPNANTTFTFDVIAPTTPGTYREYFQLVSENMTWMEDYGIYWNIKVE